MGKKTNAEYINVNAKVLPEQKHAEDYYKNGPRKGKELNKPHRPWVLKAARHIQDLPGVIVGYADPEYKALECCMTDEEAKLILKMKLLVDYTVEELAKKMKWSVEKTARVAEHMAATGILSTDPADPNHLDANGKPQRTYHFTIFVPGILEALVDNVKLAEQFPQIPEAFAEYTIKRIIPLAGNLKVGHGVMRVIPIESAIDKLNPDEHERISHYFKDENETYSVAPCSCRVSRRIMGEGCGHLEEDMCIQIGGAARGFIHTGRARKISRQEAFEIMEKAEHNGLMHEIPNIDGVGKTHALCNCCGCSCFSLRTGEYFHTATMIRSNYISEVDPEKCVACGECVEICPMNALHLGERLKNKKEIQIETPLHAYDHKWGADKWNPNFRYNREMILDETGTAPCKVACPAHIAIEGYLELAREGRFEEALELIKKKNPFPAVCGRVCNKRCELACTRNNVGDNTPVAIDDVKKFVAQLDLNKEERHLPKICHPEYHDHKMAIIGSGPAGLSAAYYLAEMGYQVTVFEKENKLGGMLTLGIPSFRLEKDVVEAEIDVIKDMGVEFKMGVEVGKDVTIEELKKQGYEAFYIAIGAQGGRKLGVPNEEGENILSGIDFLRDVNLGKQGKLSGHVAIMGGGNVAIDVARTALRMGASKVDLYCLETRDIMTASLEEIKEAEEEGIVIHNGYGVKEFVLKDGKLEKAILKKCVSVFDEQHRFAPKYDENDLLEIEVSYFLSAIGQSFVYGNLLNGTKVALTKGNRIDADPLTYQTADKDIFAGGDVYHGTRFAIDAIASGREAAESMHRHVHEGQSLLIGRFQNPYLAAYELDRDNIDVTGFDNTPRQEAPSIKIDDNMKDNRGIYNEEQVKKEASRCLKCGRTFVDETMCVGCGLCTTRCKFDAIHLRKRFDGVGTPYKQTTTSNMGHILARNLKIVFTGKGKVKTMNKDDLTKQSEKKETLR